MSGVAAIVLAAGLGSRFGGAKLTAEFRGKPLVRHAVEAALSSRADPVLVVVGHASESVRGALDGLAVSIVDNPNFGDGLSASLRAGFAALPPDSRAAAILLADMPTVSAALIDDLVEAWSAGQGALVPTFRDRRGNPVVIPRDWAADIAALTGDVGAGPLLRRRADVREFAVDDQAVLLDADTPQALLHLDPFTS